MRDGIDRQWAWRNGGTYQTGVLPATSDEWLMPHRYDAWYEVPGAVMRAQEADMSWFWLWPTCREFAGLLIAESPFGRQRHTHAARSRLYGGRCAPCVVGVAAVAPP